MKKLTNTTETELKKAFLIKKRLFSNEIQYRHPFKHRLRYTKEVFCKTSLGIRKNTFGCLLSIYNITRFTHQRWDDKRSMIGCWEMGEARWDAGIFP